MLPSLENFRKVERFSKSGSRTRPIMTSEYMRYIYLRGVLYRGMWPSCDGHFPQKKDRKTMRISNRLIFCLTISSFMSVMYILAELYLLRSVV